MSLTIRSVPIHVIADVYGVSSETVRQWAVRGLIPAFQTPGGHWRIREDHLQQVISGSVPSSPAEGTN